MYEETEAALDMDDLVSSHPVYAPIDDPTEIDSFGDSLTVSKVTFSVYVDFFCKIMTVYRL